MHKSILFLCGPRLRMMYFVLWITFGPISTNSSWMKKELVRTKPTLTKHHLKEKEGRKGCALMLSLLKANWDRRADRRPDRRPGTSKYRDACASKNYSVTPSPPPALCYLWEDKGSNLKICPRVSKLRIWLLRGWGRCLKVTMQTHVAENFRSCWWGAEQRV